MKKKISDKEKGERCVKAVEQYFKITPLEKVPLNNFKTINITHVLSSLGLNDCERDNIRIKSIIEDNNAKLVKARNEVNDVRMPDNFHRFSDPITEKLDYSLTSYRKQISEEKWFLACGRQIRR